MELIATRLVVSSVQTRTVNRITGLVSLALLVSMEKCVTMNAKEVVQEISVNNLLMQRSALWAVRMAAMVLHVIRPALTTAWTASVSRTVANVQPVCQENRETSVIQVRPSGVLLSNFSLLRVCFLGFLFACMLVFIANLTS